MPQGWAWLTLSEAAAPPRAALRGGDPAWQRVDRATPSVILNASPNTGLCRARLGGCHPAWHLGCHAACCCAPLLLLVQGLGWICPLWDTSPLLPLVSWDLQGTPQLSQTRELLKQSPKEGRSKCHVRTSEGPAQARASPTASRCLACSLSPGMELYVGSLLPCHDRGEGTTTGWPQAGGWRQALAAAGTQTRLGSAAAD